MSSGPQYLGTEYGEKLSLGGERERKTGIGQGCIIMHDFLNDMFSRQNENGGRRGRKGFIMDEKRAERIGTVMSLFLSYFARKVTRLFEQWARKREKTFRVRFPCFPIPDPFASKSKSRWGDLWFHWCRGINAPMGVGILEGGDQRNIKSNFEFRISKHETGRRQIFKCVHKLQRAIFTRANISTFLRARNFHSIRFLPRDYPFLSLHPKNGPEYLRVRTFNEDNWICTIPIHNPWSDHSSLSIKISWLFRACWTGQLSDKT